MLHPDSICFGLIAGGQSRRMGVDKASLRWRGLPLWQHQLRLAAEIGAQEILISGKSDGPYCAAARVVPDEISNAGPIAGLAAIFGAMSSEWLVVVAVDMPFLEADVLRSLLGARRGGRGVVPRLGGRVEPLAAVYPRGLAAAAQTHLTQTDRSLQAFARTAYEAGLVEVLECPVTLAPALRSLNTPLEWDAAAKA